MESDDQVSVCSELSVSSKSLNYDDNESSTCDSIITTFHRCTVKVEDLEIIPLSPVTEEVEEVDLTNNTVAEIPLVDISSECDSDKTMESAATPICNINKEQEKKDNSTNTENYGYRRKMFRQANGTYYKYRPYGYNHNHPHQHNNYYHRNYYQRPLYNNYQQKQFSYMNYYQNRSFCNKWDCQMRHRQNEQFRNMLFRGIFHFTKFLEYISQTNF